MHSLPKEFRVAAGLTVEKAAEKLKISAGYLSQIENGKRNVSSKRAGEIATLYGVKKEEIFLPTRFSIREVYEVKITNHNHGGKGGE